MRDDVRPHALEPQATVVVYRRDSGEILGVHHFGAVEGVELPARDELAELALRQALVELEPPDLDIAALHVDPGDLRPRVDYRVSPEDGVLVEVQPHAGSA